MKYCVFCGKKINWLQNWLCNCMCDRCHSLYWEEKNWLDEERNEKKTEKLRNKIRAVLK